MSASVDDRRPAELVAALASVRTRLADAALASGRDVWSLTLIAVTKSFPSADVAILRSLGVLDIGESRDQEARAKLAQLAAADAQRERQPAPGQAGRDADRVPMRLHFIGRLQTNKCRAVASYADCVHTVDRLAVASALAEGAQAADRPPLPVFVQVSLDGDPSRGGVPMAGLAELADAVADDQRLRLLGVMAVAPLAQSPDDAYSLLAEVSTRLRESHPGAAAISAGMSGDFESAVRHGATHVRIGSALLGRREASFS